MTLPTSIWFCEEHRSPTGDRHIDGVSRCFLALDEGLIIRDCRFIELRVAGPDDLLIRRENGKWPESATTTLAAAFINNERGVGQHPDVVLDLLAATEGEE